MENGTPTTLKIKTRDGKVVAEIPAYWHNDIKVTVPQD